MIKANFDSESGAYIVQFIGIVSIDEILEYIISTMNNNTFPRKLKIITDARRANMDFSPKDLSRIVEANMKSLEKYEMITDAIVLDSPKETALSILYQELSLTNKYRFQVFSTQEAALNWLNNY